MEKKQFYGNSNFEDHFALPKKDHLIVSISAAVFSLLHALSLSADKGGTVCGII